MPTAILQIRGSRRVIKRRSEIEAKGPEAYGDGRGSKKSISF
jgi:hypothetical protein